MTVETLSDFILKVGEESPDDEVKVGETTYYLIWPTGYEKEGLRRKFGVALTVKGIITWRDKETGEADCTVYHNGRGCLMHWNELYASREKAE